MPFYIVILAKFKITVIRRSSMHKVHEFVVQGTYEAILEWQIFPQITSKLAIQLGSKMGCEYFSRCRLHSFFLIRMEFIRS